MSESPCSNCGRFLLFKSTYADKPYCLNAKCVTNHMTLNPVLQQIQISFECEPTQLDSSSSDILGSDCTERDGCINRSQVVYHSDEEDSSLAAHLKEHMTETPRARTSPIAARHLEKSVLDKDLLETSSPEKSISASTRTFNDVQTPKRTDFKVVTSTAPQGWSAKRNCDIMLAARDDPIESSLSEKAFSSKKISHGLLKSNARKKKTTHS